MSGEITDDSSFVKTDTNSFVTSTSKQSSRRSRRPYSFQLDQKIELNCKLQLDNNTLLIWLLFSAKMSSINEITEPSTKVSYIDEIHNSKATIKYNTTINHAMSIPPTRDAKSQYQTRRQVYCIGYGCNKSCNDNSKWCCYGKSNHNTSPSAFYSIENQILASFNHRLTHLSTTVKKYHETLHTINNKTFREQESIIIILVMFNILLII